jgi:hypothetical protein
MSDDIPDAPTLTPRRLVPLPLLERREYFGQVAAMPNRELALVGP